MSNAMKFGPLEMYQAAMAQANDRASRTGRVCTIYRKAMVDAADVWYVCAEGEEIPAGAECIARVRPAKKGAGG